MKLKIYKVDVLIDSIEIVALSKSQAKRKAVNFFKYHFLNGKGLNVNKVKS
jgi:hypothetical protein